MRIKSIVLTDLVNDRLVSYENLEKEMNSNKRAEVKAKNIKKYLDKIARTSQMITLWEEIIKENNDEAKIITENG